MGKKLLTDTELRANFARLQNKNYSVEQGTIITPAARDFIKEQGIVLNYIPSAAAAQSGSTKPEEMTCLRGNIMVPKTDARIIFRGKLDSLEAKIIVIQTISAEKGHKSLVRELEEILQYVRQIMSADVREEPLPPIRLFGMDGEKLHFISHNASRIYGVKDPVPNYTMGEICVYLNEIRTVVREAELAAAKAFSDANGNCSRRDILEGLNRLSSAVYVIYSCRLGKFYGDD